ncbi:MAG TPA: sugar phosphate nucleotidyltransferase [Hyphomonas sp.]|nr:mannose-1-phosphate guanyltransferase [Hyphomonas sp.]MCB9970054.1 mannose-1-phosphate guanyltransferase [Hyphomonas sp.]MCC0050355.1 mannose-1-phosphate guanyltransferase [Rhodobiaceae bacterium]HPE49192.1 sugar phosphate nucleotidyltransferase [Hyphomonas sp.]
MAIHPVIMCGGAGTRLWPVSTQAHPKQFHRLVTDKTVFQDTVLRLGGDGFAPPVVISNERYAGLIGEQLAEIGVAPGAVLLEPVARNTAAVAAVAARHVAAIDPEGLCLLLPSDHFIGRPDVFVKAVLEAASVARSGFITTFGIHPDRPDTGFGYIHRGEPIEGSVSRIAAFREKPDLETAESYIADPAFSWNAGIFLFPATLMISELQALAPDILETATDALNSAHEVEGGRLLDPAHFGTVRSTSIDYAVMESTSHAAVYAPLDCQWNDIGTWTMINELRQNDDKGGTVNVDATNCSVHSDASHMVALVGVENLTVVIEGNRILIAAKDHIQDIKNVVTALRESGREDLL